ncbi:hypothetical protein [Alloprevotella tannerae]|uniref:hypothetical protein n=1 Tax=Alloprevotella tannerae TaxID=76122 RepID=UPI001EDC92C8|nr:hypothetical protein [Alloprevotella tannerae]
MIMFISQKTIEKLRELINEETEYRSGSKLVAFFNQYGFRDVYGNGFPSRWIYTEEKIRALNGTPELDRCIKDVFAPINFIGRFSELDSFIADFNQYLCFDGWNVIRKGSEITFSKATSVDIDKEKEKERTVNNTEADFLNAEFADISVESLPIDNYVLPYIDARISEIKTCLSAKASLSVIFLSGSTLEGVLLGLAQNSPAMYNQAKSAPKDNKTGKIRQFHEWTLSNLIDVSCEIGFLREDVKKFSHSLRDFRNYIHPFQQMSEHFSPDENTAKICFQVLKAALFQITQNKKR